MTASSPTKSNSAPNLATCAPQNLKVKPLNDTNDPMSVPNEFWTVDKAYMPKTMIGTYPYPVVKGFPTYNTDYAMFGAPSLSKEEVEYLESGGSRSLPKLNRERNERSPKAIEKARKKRAEERAKSYQGKTDYEGRKIVVQHPSMKLKKNSMGEYVQRPPLSRSPSFGELQGIHFTGTNFKEQTKMQRMNYRRGLRLSSCYDNATSFGGKSWTTTNAEIGSVVEPALLKKKRHGVMSFENSRFLPDHPHWKDRPYKPGQNIKCPKSTYMDLGSFYLPPDQSKGEAFNAHRSEGDPHMVWDTFDDRDPDKSFKEAAKYKIPPPRVKLPSEFLHSVQKLKFRPKKNEPVDETSLNMGMGGFSQVRTWKTQNATKVDIHEEEGGEGGGGGEGGT